MGFVFQVGTPHTVLLLPESVTESNHTKESLFPNLSASAISLCIDKNFDASLPGLRKSIYYLILNALIMSHYEYFDIHWSKKIPSELQSELESVGYHVTVSEAGTFISSK